MSYSTRSTVDVHSANVNFPINRRFNEVPGCVILGDGDAITSVISHSILSYLSKILKNIVYKFVSSPINALSRIKSSHKLAYFSMPCWYLLFIQQLIDVLYPVSLLNMHM